MPPSGILFIFSIMIRNITFILLSLLTLAACSTESSKIKQAALQYSTAMGNYDFDEARKFATEQTCNITIDFYQHIALPNLDTAYIRANTPATITITKVEQTSDTTATAYFHKTTPSSSADGDLNLVKRQGEWKADVVIAIPPAFRAISHPRKAIPQNLKAPTSKS